jgi:4,5-DOPA dioxygenase extradiol
MFPALFLSHGAPTLPLVEAPATSFLRQLGERIGRPRAIIVASAHWETLLPTVSTIDRNTTIHDFHGFPRELYEMRYEPPGDPALAEQAADLLTEAGLSCDTDPTRGLDHGAWVPLQMMYPSANIPTLQISIQPHLGPTHHLRVGQALAPLRGDDVLIIGSGAFTHDLAHLRRSEMDAPPPPDVLAFTDWFDKALEQQRIEDLLAYRRLAPFAARQHPTDEHLLPLYVAMGAGGAAVRLHASTMYSTLAWMLTLSPDLRSPSPTP